jgi:probable F420-dependent oxidoreductase
VTVKIGIMFANGGRSAEPDHAIGLAQAAEAAGYDSLWAVQHVVIPIATGSRYPYSSAGTIPGGGAVAIPDPLVWLAYIASATSSIRLATGVLVLPQQSALVVAKQAATLDRLSGGRLTLGVGAGWLREEFDALGVAFEGRGHLLDEQIEVLRAAWSHGSAQFEGSRIRFDEVAIEPKPAQASIPIVVGGHTPAAVRRAARLGDGFFPLAKRGDELKMIIEQLRRWMDQAGRPWSSVEITADAPRDAAQADRIHSLGVHRVLVNAPAVPLDGLDDALRHQIEMVKTRMAGP